MATSLSSSMAEEFIICSKCHHPMETQGVTRSIAQSRFTDHTSTPCSNKPRSHIYASTPYNSDHRHLSQSRFTIPSQLSESICELPSDLNQSYDSTCEIPRDADQSYLGDNFTPEPDSFLPEAPHQSVLKDYNLTLGQCSFLELPPSRIAGVTDLELSEEFLPGYLNELPVSTSLALCQSCSIYGPLTPNREYLHGNGRPGSLMSMYFPDKTGIDLSNQGSQSHLRSRRDSMCYSVSSEDSGACDVDDIPSNECSMHEHMDQSACSKSEISAKLQTSFNLDRNNNQTNTSSFEVIDTPTKLTNKSTATPVTMVTQQHDTMESLNTSISTSIIHEITFKLDRHHDNIEQMHAVTDAKFATVRGHLEDKREYYHELVEQWYWKHLVTLQQSQEEVKRDQEDRAESAKRAVAEIRTCVHDLEMAQQQQLSLARYSVDLRARLRQLDQLVLDLKESVGARTEVTFTVGRCEQLTTDHLGGVLIQRRPKTESIPQHLLPGRCLGTFDSRQGATSEYMATGLSLTTRGDLIVTDTGMDCVNVFSSSGVHKLTVNTVPEEYPTTASQINDVIAVACNDRINLYNMTDGVYHSTQLPQCLTRPQGVTTDTHGNLVTSAQRIDIPAVAVYNRESLVQTDLVIGDTKCALAMEDVIGSELLDPTNQVLFSKPWYVAVNQSDEFVVSDRDSHIVRVISRSGEVREQFGGLGHRPGQLFQPAGLCVDPHGRIIIADSQNHRVQVLTPGGEHHAVSVVTQEHDGIECPMDVALDASGRLYVLQGDGLVRSYQYC